nr:G protein-coupled receptor [Proales similis]
MNSYRLEYVSACCLIWLLSLAGNLIAIAGVLRQKELRRSAPMVLTVHLLVAEIGYSTFTLPFIVHELLIGKPVLEQDALFCFVQGGLVVVSGLAVILFLQLISLNRFLFLFKPRVYQTLFGEQRVHYFSALVWFVILIAVAIQLSNVSEIQFDEKLLFCRIAPPNFANRSVFISVLVFGPAILTISVYVTLLNRIWTLKRWLQREPGRTDWRMEAIKFIELLFCSWLLTFALGLPLLLIVLFDLSVSMVATQICFLLTAVQTSTNWIVISTGSPYLRHSIRALVCKRRVRNDSIDERVLNGIRVLYDDQF